MLKLVLKNSMIPVHRSNFTGKIWRRTNLISCRFSLSRFKANKYIWHHSAQNKHKEEEETTDPRSSFRHNRKSNPNRFQIVVPANVIKHWARPPQRGRRRRHHGRQQEWKADKSVTAKFKITATATARLYKHAQRLQWHNTNAAFHNKSLKNYINVYSQQLWNPQTVRRWWSATFRPTLQLMTSTINNKKQNSELKCKKRENFKNFLWV